MRHRKAPRSAATLALALALALPGCTLPRWPVEAPLSSPWGLRLMGWRPDFHEGVDMPVPVGTPVRTMAPGTVVRAGTAGGYGVLVEIDHGRGTVTRYAHLSELKVRAGERVEARQVIALSGRSGNVTGPHLHFEIRRWGRPEDPVPLLGGMP